MNQSVSANPSLRQQAAVFVDYDNLLDVIRAEHSGDKYPDEYAAEILVEAQRYIKNRNNLPLSIARAYADFGALDDDAPYVQRSLKRDGFEPRYVPSDLQRNAGELQLSLDVVDAISQHPSLDTVVVISGDRLYLPLIRRVAEHGRHVLAIVLFPPQAEDAFFAKDDVFLDARNLLSEASQQAFPDHDRPAYEAPQRLEPHEYEALTDPIVRRTVKITESHFGQYDEVYLTPLLRKLSEVLGPDHDPKSLISRLEDAGAVRLEKRNGYPYDYTVLIMHDDHPDVQELRDEMDNQSSYGDGYYDDSYADDNYSTEDYDAPSSYDAEDEDTTDDVAYPDEANGDAEAYGAAPDDATWEQQEEQPS
jgi:uncharacterized LabA/DUF88 family protein